MRRVWRRGWTMGRERGLWAGHHSWSTRQNHYTHPSNICIRAPTWQNAPQHSYAQPQIPHPEGSKLVPHRSTAVIQPFDTYDLTHTHLLYLQQQVHIDSQPLPTAPTLSQPQVVERMGRVIQFKTQNITRFIHGRSYPADKHIARIPPQYIYNHHIRTE